jgi:hypothetical protein
VTRSGQIQLKIYPALNGAEPRDFEDIRALAPDARETEDSLRWFISSFPVLSHLNRLPIPVYPPWPCRPHFKIQEISCWSNPSISFDGTGPRSAFREIAPRRVIESLILIQYLPSDIS